MGFFPFNPKLGQEIQGEGHAKSDMAFLGHYSCIPQTVSATGIHAALALTAAAQPGVTTGITQPGSPAILTAKANAAGCAGNVVIHGTDIAGNTISDTIALADATEIAGTKAFKTVTSIDFPAQTHAGTDTCSIGITKKLGLPWKVANTSLFLVKLFNAAVDAGTATLNADIAKNIYEPAGAPDNAKVVDLYAVL